MDAPASILYLPIIALAGACWAAERGRCNTPSAAALLSDVAADPRMLVVPLDRAILELTGLHKRMAGRVVSPGRAKVISQGCKPLVGRGANLRALEGRKALGALGARIVPGSSLKSLSPFQGSEICSSTYQGFAPLANYFRPSRANCLTNHTLMKPREILDLSLTLTTIREMHDRQIVATALVRARLGASVALPTCDGNIAASGLVPIVW